MGVEVAAGAALVGAGVEIYGQREANKRARQAEKQNAAYIEQQRKLTMLQNRREADLFQEQSAAFIGDQVSSFAKAGVDMSGSVLMAIAGSKSAADREYNSILTMGRAKDNMYSLQIAQSRANSDLYGDAQYNNIQSLGSLLNAAGSIAQASSWDSSKPKTSSSSSSDVVAAAAG